MEHIFSRSKIAKTVPFYIQKEWKNIPNSSQKKLEVDLDFFEGKKWIVKKDKPYFSLLENRIIPRSTFVIPVFSSNEEASDKLLINAYLDSIFEKKE